MSNQTSKKAGLKQKAARQVEALVKIFVYLAFSFCAVVTYRLLLLHEFHTSYFDYGTALLNALIVAKVILIGEDVHLGKRVEDQPLLLSAISKALLFGLLVFAFHIVEEAVKRLVHGNDLAGAWHEAHLDEVLARCVIIFCTFVPLFLFL